MLPAAALASLGFAIAFWPVWMPWRALSLSVGRLGRARQRLMRLCSVMGSLLAGLLYPLIVCLPLLFPPGWRLRCSAVALVLASAPSQVVYQYIFSPVWCYYSRHQDSGGLWLGPGR